MGDRRDAKLLWRRPPPRVRLREAGAPPAAVAGPRESLSPTPEAASRSGDVHPPGVPTTGAAGENVVGSTDPDGRRGVERGEYRTPPAPRPKTRGGRACPAPPICSRAPARTRPILTTPHPHQGDARVGHDRAHDPPTRGQRRRPAARVRPLRRGLLPRAEPEAARAGQGPGHPLPHARAASTARTRRRRSPPAPTSSATRRWRRRRSTRWCTTCASAGPRAGA